MSTELLEGLPSLQRNTLDVQIYKALRSAILEGRLQGGERLVQEELAQRMGTSRIPVRDALKTLLSDGLLTVDERGRYYVASFGVADLREVYALRALLEPYAARVATGTLDEPALRDLEGVVSEMAKAARAKDADRYVELNNQFHMSLYEASAQSRLIRMIESLWSGMPPRTPILLPEQMATSLREHQAMLKALRDRDAETVGELLQRHIERTAGALEKHLATHRSEQAQ